MVGVGVNLVSRRYWKTEGLYSSRIPAVEGRLLDQRHLADLWASGKVPWKIG
jgi:hypothetical protein